MTKMTLTIAAATMLLACAPEPRHTAEGATAGSEAAAVDPCRGSALTLERAMAECRVDDDGARLSRQRVGSALVVAVEPFSVRSGESAPGWVAFRNTSADPLELVFPPLIRVWASIERDGEQVDVRDEYAGPPVGAGCSGDCRFSRVVLEPGGTLRASVDVTARVRVRRAAADGPGFEHADGGPIEPGRYDLVIWTPVLGPDGRQITVPTTLDVSP